MPAVLHVMAAMLGKVLWLATMAGAGLGAASFAFTYLNRAGTAEGISAPQLAALASETLVYAIVPYVFARGWEKLIQPISDPKSTTTAPRP